MNAVLTVPNLLTVSRICAAPWVYALANRHHDKAVVVLLLLAGITDFLDGFWARYAQCTTVLGSLLDPLADKLLMLFSFATIYRDFPALSVCVIGRDMLILAGFVFIAGFGLDVQIAPSYVSKVNTFLVLLFLVLYWVECVWGLEWISLLLPVLSWSIFVTLALSFAGYFRVFLKACLVRWGSGC